MLKLGLTGGIAGGKSEVGRMLAARGACVVDADRVAHSVYQPGSEGFQALVAAFGPGIVAPDGAIDRRRLGAIVFNDAAQRRRLTDIVWPLTRRAVEQLAAQQEAAGTRVFVVEAPLLVEAGWHDLFDAVWFVRAPREAVVARLKTRGLSDAEIEARLAAATDSAAAASIADLVIDNNGTIEDLQRLVDAAWNQLTATA